MIEIDIAEFMQMWHGGAPSHYFDKIHSASDQELREFKIRVREHERNNPEVRRTYRHAFANVRNMTVYDVIVGGIVWEQTKRSKYRLWLHERTFPFRRAWVDFWDGEDLTVHTQIGPIQTSRNNTLTLFKHLGFKRYIGNVVLFPFLRYIVRNVFWIVPTIVAVFLAIYFGPNIIINITSQ